MDETHGTVDSISVTTFRQELDDASDLAVLDVREDHEREHVQIPLPEGVVDLHVPMSRLMAEVDAVKQSAAGRRLVVYCHHGQRSMVAATWLLGRGVERPINLDGGIDAWSIRVDRSLKRY